MYAVVRGGDLVLDDLTGIDGGRVDVVRVGELAAIVGRVPLDEFGEETLAQRVDDVRWVAEKALAHDAVVERLAAGDEPVLPFRFGTIYLAEEQLEARLRAEADALHAALRRVEGMAEVAVRATIRRPPSDAASGASSGTDYLLRKKRERDADAELAARASRVGAQVHDGLAAAAADAVANPPRAPETDGDIPVLNGAYLVPRDRLGEFAAVVRSLEQSDESLRLDLSGPWPPYNFVEARP